MVLYSIVIFFAGVFFNHGMHLLIDPWARHMRAKSFPLTEEQRNIIAKALEQVDVKCAFRWTKKGIEFVEPSKEFAEKTTT